MCKGECVSCPFACTEESVYAQTVGCLPSPYELVELKRTTGHNWSCHGDPSKMCGGYAAHIAQYNPELDVKSGNLINADIFLNESEDIALFLAEQGIVVEQQDRNNFTTNNKRRYNLVI